MILATGIMSQTVVNGAEGIADAVGMPDQASSTDAGPEFTGASEVDRELSEAEKIELGFERQTVQPEWIQRFGIVSDDIRRRLTSSEDFVEVVSPLVLVAFDSENENAEVKFVVSAVKASEWMFITFTDSESEAKKEFFFPYSAIASTDKIFLRELNEECVRPNIMEPQPPTVAKCHYFYKKINEAYEFSVKEVGPTEGADLLECYVESVKKMTRQPRVEILCVEGGIQDSQYKELTREQLEKIKATHKDLGNGQFEGALEETETVKVNAK